MTDDPTKWFARTVLAAMELYFRAADMHEPPAPRIPLLRERQPAVSPFAQDGVMLGLLPVERRFELGDLRRFRVQQRQRRRRAQRPGFRRCLLSGVQQL
jgi:hypothetical protein